MATARGNTRTTGTEQYYTPAHTAHELTALVLDTVPGSERRPWLEPAAGTGAFLTALQHNGIQDVHAYDIEPKAAGIQRADFLTTQPNLTDAVCLTNPPFGRNNALSVPFFNHAANFSDYIGFIVPRSWRKWSVLNRLDPRMHRILDIDVTTGYVDDHGLPLSDSTVLKTVFQIWERRPELRPLITVEDRGYLRKCSPADADVALTVFGASCGTVRTEFDRVPNSTRMFLNAAPHVITALKAVDLSVYYSNVAYIPALSWAEINAALNAHFDARATTTSIARTSNADTLAA
jgi:hypothetical protein